MWTSTKAGAETWRRVWGDAKMFRGHKKFLNELFPEKNSILTPKHSDDLFLVIDQVFLILTLSFQILCIFIVSNFVYDPFFTTKSPLSTKNFLTTPFFYSVQAFVPIPQHYFSKYWGDQCMGRHPSKIWGGRAPVPPRSPPLHKGRGSGSCGRMWTGEGQKPDFLWTS